MSSFLERLPSLLHEQREAEATLRAHAADPSLDRTGIATNMLVAHLRLLALGAFAVDRDPLRFRQLLRESAQLAESLFIRSEAKAPISASYVSLVSVASLFDALASGDMELSVSFARRLGTQADLETQHTHPFTRALGYALKALVLPPPTDIESSLEAFRRECRRKGNTLDQGYADCMQSIHDGDPATFERAIRSVVQAHPRLAASGRRFHLTPDEGLCFWGLGLTNLALARGLSVWIDCPLIPGDLQGVVPDGAC